MVVSFAAHIEYVLASCVVPCLMKKKASSLAVFQKRYKQEFDNFEKILDGLLAEFDVKFRIFWKDEKAYYVFIYDEKFLGKLLRDSKIICFLKDFGYEVAESNIDQYINNLQYRFGEYKKKQQEFPDEIGVFLGYPLSDVVDYIRNKGKNYMVCGYWKVYHNEKRALDIFCAFDELRRDAIRLICSGKPLMYLREEKGQQM